MRGPLHNFVGSAILMGSMVMMRLACCVTAPEKSTSAAVPAMDWSTDKVIDGGVALGMDPDHETGWTADGNGHGTTYSVIVVASDPHTSNLCRDMRRVRAYNQGVVSVQFVSPHPSAGLDTRRGESPFYARHPQGVDERVRIVHVTDLVEAGGILDTAQVSHLKAACEDPSERTVLMITDETCARLHIPTGVPAACWSNVARHYPYNAPSPDVETRHAYLPLGPRDNFPFIEPERHMLASKRPLLFNLEITRRTSSRRTELVRIVHHYRKKHRDVPCHKDGKQLDPVEWQNLLLDSKFTISPGGHNPETFRIFEALEAGSIPIVSKEDFREPTDGAPYPCGKGNASWNTVAASPFAKTVSVDTWQDLPELLDRLFEEPPDAIDKLQTQCKRWYAAVMSRTYGSLLDFGQGQELWPQAGPILGDFDDPS